jgi:hypothetical protein
MRLSIAVFAMVLLLVPAPAAEAQDQPVELETGFFMMNQYMCPLHLARDVNREMRDLFVPIWRELQEEGAIRTAGFLDHAWGDEWNVNFFIVADNHRAFLDAWDEMIRRANQRDPEWFDRIAPLCDRHKDNLYTMRSLP